MHIFVDPFTGEDAEVVIERAESGQKAQEDGGRKSKRARREIEVARQVVKTLGRPIAALPSPINSAVKFWSYTPTHGWTEDEAVKWLADEIHGASGERILGIIGRKFALPTHLFASSCFARWVPADHPDPDEAYYRGHWEPFIPRANEVYFANGKYDLDTNEFVPFVSPIFGPLISVPYDPDARNEVFERAVERHFVGRPEELRRFKQECGRILQPHVPVKYEVYVISHIRDNGKSTLMNAIAAAPGGKNGMSTLSQREMSEDMFALAGLMNRFANVSSDSGSTRKWGEMLHKLTSGPVSIRYMHREPFSATLTAKLWNTCNVMQTLDDTAGNMSNRVKIFEFRGAAYARTGAHGDDAVLNVDVWTSVEMRKAIVAWMFDGLFDLRNNGPVEEPREEVERRLNEADPERALLLDRVRVTKNPDDFVSSAELALLLWPGDSSNERSKGIKLARRMLTLFGLEPTMKKVDGRVVRGYTGIALN